MGEGVQGPIFNLVSDSEFVTLPADVLTPITQTLSNCNPEGFPWCLETLMDLIPPICSSTCAPRWVV